MGGTAPILGNPNLGAFRSFVPRHDCCMTQHLVLVKHALPVPDTSRPAREWLLGEEGEIQALRIADALKRFAPFRLVSSTEPKAARTAEIVAREVGIDFTEIEGLREIDRPKLPWMGDEEHAAFNKQLFVNFDEAVVGAESARDAVARFEDALMSVTGESDGTNVVAIAHGTVISLLAAKHNPEIDGFDLWRKLRCSDFVVLSMTDFTIVQSN